MAKGIYTAERREVRDGVLVCFKGERMTMDEAVRRGLVEPPAAAPKGTREERKEALMAKTAAQLAEIAAQRGASYPKGAVKSVVADAILDAEESK